MHEMGSLVQKTFLFSLCIFNSRSLTTMSVPSEITVKNSSVGNLISEQTGFYFCTVAQCDRLTLPIVLTMNIYSLDLEFAEALILLIHYISSL